MKAGKEGIIYFPIENKRVSGTEKKLYSIQRSERIKLGIAQTANVVSIGLASYGSYRGNDVIEAISIFPLMFGINISLASKNRLHRVNRIIEKRYKKK
jgi:hypothetical protein